MRKKQYKPSNHRGLQVITLCISTAMVLILLGLVIFSVLMGRNLSSYVKENLVVQVMLEQDMTNPEGLQMCKRLNARPYVNTLTYITKEEALKEATRDLGADPSEFAGVNPFQPSIEITTKADYANNDSLKWITKELKAFPRVTEVTYQHDLIEQVNNSLAKISIGLLIVAALLTFISFSLINNTVRLGIYARRFSIHTMKLVGASWGFIRRPFLRKAVLVGGDYNTAHFPIDLARPKANENTSGFLRIERDWLDKIVEHGWVDTFRKFNPDPDEYSWWSYRSGAHV